jgi:hypothetical protein
MLKKRVQYVVTRIGASKRQAKKKNARMQSHAKSTCAVRSCHCKKIRMSGRQESNLSGFT